jgi:hypothetical protein
MPRLVAHVHHDLPLALERVHCLFETPQLLVGQVERDPEHRLLVGAPPFVGQVTLRAELAESAALELLVQLPDVAFNRGPFHPQPQLAHLLAKDSPDLRVQGLELDHGHSL